MRRILSQASVGFPLSNKEILMPLRRSRSSYSDPASDVAPSVRLWLLRMLVPLGAHREFVNRAGFQDDSLAEALGLQEWLAPELDDFDPKTVRIQLRKLHQEAESQCPGARLSACLDANVARLAKLVGLSATDCRILEFVAMLKSERLLDDTGDWLGQLTSAKVIHALAVLLDLPEPEIRDALSTHGALVQSGLVSLDRGHRAMLSGKLELLSDQFADHIVSSEFDPVVLLRDTVAPAAPSQLKLSDYKHVKASLAVLRPYLRRALSSGRTGVNVLIHGAPGTGKSSSRRQWPRISTASCSRSPARTTTAIRSTASGGCARSEPRRASSGSDGQ
jgi:transitional endoplasmic reticulum ATPase